MRVYLDSLEALVTFTWSPSLHVALEPGIWIVQENGIQHAVTTLTALVDPAGGVHLTFPKGVRSRSDGSWGVVEYLLAGALPRSSPAATWKGLPARIRELIQDAYVLAHANLPATIGPASKDAQ